MMALRVAADAAVLLQSKGAMRAMQHLGLVLPISHLWLAWATGMVVAGLLLAISWGVTHSRVEGLLLAVSHACLSGMFLGILGYNASVDREVLDRHFAACERWLESVSARRLAGHEFADAAAALGVKILAARLHAHMRFFYRISSAESISSAAAKAACKLLGNKPGANSMPCAHELGLASSRAWYRERDLANRQAACAGLLMCICFSTAVHSTRVQHSAGIKTL